MTAPNGGVALGRWLLTTRATEAVEKRTDADWILKAMVAIAAADGRLDAREVGLIRKVYQEQTGRSVDVSGVLLAVQAYASKRDVLAELAAAAGDMSQETKREIIRAAYLRLLADKRVAEEERRRVKDIAAVLRISENEFQAIVKGIEPPSRKGRM
jgi:tellurite resistance protein